MVARRKQPGVTWKLYVEGGGDSDELRTKCRKGFSELLRKAGFDGRLPRVVPGGGRTQAFDLFRTAVRNREDNEVVVLLVDSETARDPTKTKWQHLADRDNWEKPDGGHEGQQDQRRLQQRRALVRSARTGRPRQSANADACRGVLRHHGQEYPKTAMSAMEILGKVVMQHQAHT